ncbi:hypothetical protein [Aureispira anguillae]|uniref:Outer membrane protein beta-barrel domain-containing protein n=1 Tax=Aureispira anguillae TaxID=2864201 RepID=A0A915YKW4_9BACT|nr:hypothetical protein [Aureispira anguillae]BDS14821.1 hypothetical protein AsAng_0056030 [Aureispira anguillae]
MMRFVFFMMSCCFVIPSSFGQYYIFGGYNYGAITMKGANVIINAFNERENHSIAPFANNFHGYRVGAGKYSKYSVMELGFGNLISNQKSTNPNQLRENAEVIINYMSATARAGIKPFPKHHFTFGAAMHLGAQRIRYSFGGDYQTPVNKYVIAPEFYLDYAIRIKFLLKKSQREKYFYLLRIRPYYQLHSIIGIGNFEKELNQTPNITSNAIEDNMSHFGFNISIVIPFLSDDDRAYLYAPKKRKKRSTKRDRKERPKGRL